MLLFFFIESQNFYIEETADVSRSAKRTKPMRGTLIVKDGVSENDDYFCI